MVDARNAMLAADTLRFGGANQAELWLAFARRGLGAGASATNGTAGARVESDTDPLPDFAAPGTGNATLTFAATARDAAQAPVNARIYVGHYEARVSPIADTNPATAAPAGATSDNLDATAAFAPGTYEFVATAPGYGAVRFRRTVRAGVAQSLTLRMAANVASKTQGAAASGDATAVVNGPNTVLTDQQVRDQLIDDTENTWLAGRRDAERPGLDRRRPPGDRRPRRHAPAACHPRPGERLPRAAVRPGRARRPRAEPVHGAAPVRAVVVQRVVRRLRSDDGYNRIYASAANASRGDAPRPVAPTLLLREFTFSPVQATHLRLVVRNSQCTGEPDFQGEQDADPFNATDCNAAGPASTRAVRAAELQVFGQTSLLQAG